MRKSITSILGTILFLSSINSYADAQKTVRIPQLSNERVSVWTTVIYPNKEPINNRTLRIKLQFACIIYSIAKACVTSTATKRDTPGSRIVTPNQMIC
nr:hypothetical protein [Legionella cherrii]